MNKSWLKIILGVFVVVALIFVYRAAFYTPNPGIEPGTAEQADETNLSLEQRLANRIEGRTKRAEELKAKDPEDFSVAIEDTKPTAAERLHRRILFENEIAISRTGDYQKTIDFSRRLLTEYPDTPQAVEVKNLLSKIPQQQRNKYNITEEEITP